MARGSTRKMRLPKHETTFDGVQKWFKSEFEEYGWMLLAKAKGYDFKIATYKKKIHHLIATIKHLMTCYEEKDRQHDLKVLLENTMVLKEHADRL